MDRNILYWSIDSNVLVLVQLYNVLTWSEIVYHFVKNGKITANNKNNQKQL